MADKSFLVVRLSSLGDIVHALPAVSALAKMPSATVDWVVETRYRDLLKDNPYLRNVIEIDTLGINEERWSFNSLMAILESVSILRKHRYDAVVDFQSLLKTAVLARCAGSDQRIGFTGDWAREPMAGILYTRKLCIPRQVHVIQANISLVESLGARTNHWEFPLPDDIAETRNPEILDCKSRRRMGSKALVPAELWGARTSTMESFFLANHSELRPRRGATCP